MLTPQEVSSRAFTRAPFNGYNMAMVDEFLDELTEDYTALYKENAALKAKIKVMVEKVEEYRATEDSMRAALLAAQRMADSIVQDAEARRTEAIAKAEADARAMTESARTEVEALEKRIALGKEELAKFVAESRAVCERQLAFLNELPNVRSARAPEQPAEPSEAVTAEPEEAPETASETPPEAVEAAPEETPNDEANDAAKEAAPDSPAEEGGIGSISAVEETVKGAFEAIENRTASETEREPEPSNLEDAAQDDTSSERKNKRRRPSGRIQIEELKLK